MRALQDGGPLAQVARLRQNAYGQALQRLRAPIRGTVIHYNDMVCHLERLCDHIP